MLICLEDENILFLSFSRFNTAVLQTSAWHALAELCTLPPAARSRSSLLPQAVKSNMLRLCKCHGVSGTCTVKVCWKIIRQFRQIGAFLKEQFDGASKMKYVPAEQSNRLPTRDDNRPPFRRRLVTPDPGGRRQRQRLRPVGVGRLRRRRSGSLLPINPLQKRPTKRDLVYLHDSPDFCDFNPTYGSLGTRGRECNVTSYGLDGCALMCCGRLHYSQEQLLVQDCHCKFHWCCRVVCKKCHTKVVRHFCH